MRSRLFAMLPLLVVPTFLGAQDSARGPIDRGSWLVAGGASFSRERQEASDGDDMTATSLSIHPDVLFFVVPRLAVGGQLGFNHFSSDFSSSSSWWVGPAARYYFGDPRGRTLPYLGASVLRRAISLDDDADPTFDGDGAEWTYEGVAGLTFMVSRQVGIAAEGFVTRRSLELEEDSPFESGDLTSFGLRLGFAAFVIR